MRPASLLAAAVGLGLAACAQSTFITEVRGETTVPASLPGGSTELNAFPPISSFAGMDFDQNQDFKNQGLSKSEATSVHVDSLSLQILSPNDVDFTFLDNVEFFVRAGDRESRIAWKNDLSRGSPRAPNPTLRLDLADVELQPFVAAPTMSIIIRGKGRTPEREVRLRAVVRLEVESGLL
ncbi:hypothetical protein OWM54_13815 [Myxococcus sp. MISCRS1]|uniref:hypothetical protein n=1 Tax=Myxococcus TaxID=32 RepID=UPI001CBCB41A|nr:MULTISPECIES: hypothetical protein [unclassified Myxococcus]MBZ4400172.1 hypothetical protein [Myxococcus sp. AS-1-15]MBZ4407873.1 hypothetical protein [Myxococcus sp. XM-1-1-1]MCY0998207.1 hypothetical protein [Myxococcus sp. MISCRS1]BDT31722.1 hypothetical protein MFMH1_13910 [Myxococcus sp. MH1]